MSLRVVFWPLAAKSRMPASLNMLLLIKTLRPLCQTLPRLCNPLAAGFRNRPSATHRCSPNWVSTLHPSDTVFSGVPMARITIEDCLKHIPNRFQLTLAATYRARAGPGRCYRTHGCDSAARSRSDAGSARRRHLGRHRGHSDGYGRAYASYSSVRGTFLFGHYGVSGCVVCAAYGTSALIGFAMPMLRYTHCPEVARLRAGSPSDDHCPPDTGQVGHNPRTARHRRHRNRLVVADFQHRRAVRHQQPG